VSPGSKYGRTLHAQISLGSTSDDRFMPDGYVRAFADLDLAVTEKLDGQNTCFSRAGVWARSHASPTAHPWDKPMRERWALIRHDLGDLELFGENLYGIHSLEYRKLDSYYYVFAVRQGAQWLSWEEVCFYAALFGFPVVPELPFPEPLASCFDSKLSENQVLRNWLTRNLGMPWERWTETEGCLGGWDPVKAAPACEGLVVRSRAGFSTGSGLLPVEDHAFSQLFKLVRSRHVSTDQHWTQTWKPARLADYGAWNWHGYAYLSD
jgi:hypothetical protein